VKVSGPLASFRGFAVGFGQGSDSLPAFAAYPERVLVASATIDGHAAALRLGRADTFTLHSWVDARPVKYPME
jgi:hypothetical protein